MSIQERITEKAKELYRQKYGKRSEATLSSKEVEAVVHEAAVEVRKQVQKESKPWK